MYRLSCLAALVLATGCFSDPTSAPLSSGGDSSSDGTSSTSSNGSTTSAEGSSSTMTVADESSTSVGPSTTDSSTGSDSVDTGPPTNPLDLYDECNNGYWQTLNTDEEFTKAICTHPPTDLPNEGGGWKYPTLKTPSMGLSTRVLVLRPSPRDAGMVRASFRAGPNNLGESAVLRLDYEFINTTAADVGTMTFVIELQPPSGAPFPIVEETMMPSETVGTVDAPLGIMGPDDQLVFTVIADSYVVGQGVALFEARVDPS